MILSYTLLHCGNLQVAWFLLKTFSGNYDGFSVVTHVLEPPITAMYIRMHPLSWNDQAALRAEFYGCSVSVSK